MQKNNQNAPWTDHIINTPSIELGPRSSYAMLNDPRRMPIVLSRYKFTAKMLKGKSCILEVGCGDAFGTPIVAQEAQTLLGIDIEECLIEGDKRRLSRIPKISFQTMDITQTKPEGSFDAAYSLDVLEHISKDMEHCYFENVCSCLKENAIFIVGIPNITADSYASKPGHSPHINLKSETDLRDSFAPYFINTFIFSMNDEVVHTGFTPMAHYLFAMGVGLKKHS